MKPGDTAAAARIDTHTGVIVRHPFLRIDDFPALVEIAGAGRDVGMLVHHALPGARIAVLEGKTLGVGAVAQDHRIAALGDRAKHIGAQHRAVIHRDRHVPVDAHAIAGFAALLVRFAVARAAAMRASPSMDDMRFLLFLSCPATTGHPISPAIESCESCRGLLDHPPSRLTTLVGHQRFFERPLPRFTPAIASSTAQTAAVSSAP